MTGPSLPDPGQTISVLPDVTGVDRLFSYAVPNTLRVTTGMIVRVPLGGRRVRGWVVDDAVSAPDGVALRAIEGVVSYALTGELIALARFAQWRYAGRLRPFLLAGSPDRVLRPGTALPPPALTPTIELDEADPVVIATRDLFALGGGVLQLPPNAQRLSVVQTAIDELAGRDLLVIVPERRDGLRLSEHLNRLGHSTALLPDEWPKAYGGGCVVIGTRTAAFGPARDLGGAVILDAHAEQYVEQRAPTWNAVVIAKARARLAGVPSIVVSPAPPLTLTHNERLVSFDRAFERAHWPALEVIDRRGDDPRTGLYAPPLGEIIRNALDADERPVAVILHRKGRLRLLACRSCGELARCDICGGAMRQVERPAPGEATLLSCAGCGATRPVICALCHASALKVLRVGAGRAAEELAALVGTPTVLVEGGDSEAPIDGARVIVGTEAVIYRLSSASMVVFLDFDQHLLAARFGAHEEALVLVARAGRLVGARGRHGPGAFVRRIVIQTCIPHHEVIRAAIEGDPVRLRDEEINRRAALRLPPYSAVALISGEDAGGWIGELEHNVAIEVAVYDEAPATTKRPASTRYIARAATYEALCGALATITHVGPGLRIEVDPRDI